MIYIIRHGETDGQISGKLRGQVWDDELNEKGLAQAKELANQLSNVKFDACYCSPMKRAQQTCQVVYTDKVKLDNRLLPRDYGTLIQSLAREIDRRDGVWKRDFQSTSNIESMIDFEKRVFGLLDEIAEIHKNKNILIVTHSSTSRPIKGYFLGFPPNDDYANYPVLGNTEIMKAKNKYNKKQKLD